MIKDQIKTHAGQSFEVKLDFPANDFSGRTAHFGMDMFLFLPPALDINKHNFTKHDFYKSLKTYIRLSTPSYPMTEFLNSDAFVIKELYTALDEAVQAKTQRQANILIRRIKRYVSVINKGVGDEVKRVLLVRDKALTESEVNAFITDCYQLRETYGFFLAKVMTTDISDNVKKAARWGDEYQSLMLEGQLHTLVNGLSGKFGQPSDIVNRLHQLVLSEISYRKRAQYPSVAKIGANNEHLFHRRGRLKRYIESNLFLNTDTRREGVLYEQVFFSLAAGLAMVFATTIAFASQYAFGNLTMPFFVVLVISYMFKDRIKELSRLYFDRKRKKMFFDFRTAISLQKHIQIGYMRESFRFEKLNYLPKEIKESRERMRVTEISEEWIGDKVLHYKTQINISAKKTRKLEDFDGLTQIFRLNISPFTTKMDDHEKEIFIKSKKQLKRQMIHRVYHLNLIFRFTCGSEVQYKYYKLITNKLGIRRIDRVSLGELV
jgi:hypothetical protein